jgi:hypothetical protein
VQAVLDSIASKTPADLLTATSGGAQRIVDALQGLRTTLEATQLAPSDTTGTTGTRVTSGATIITITFAAGSIVQQPGESGEALSERIVRALERRGVLQAGNTQAFGPF